MSTSEAHPGAVARATQPAEDLVAKRRLERRRVLIPFLPYAIISIVHCMLIIFKLPGSGFESEQNTLHVLWEGGDRILPLTDKRLLGQQLVALIAERYRLRNRA